MAQPSRISRLTLDEGKSQEVYQTGDDEWVDLVLIHTADNAAGDVLLSSQGQASDGPSSGILPQNVPISWRMSPGSRLTASSSGGSRQLSVFLTPAPWTSRLIQRFESFVEQMAFLVECALGRRP